MVQIMDKKNVSRWFAECSVLQKTLMVVGFGLLLYGSYWYFIFDDKLIEISRVEKNIEKLDKEDCKLSYTGC